MDRIVHVSRRQVDGGRVRGVAVNLRRSCERSDGVAHDPGLGATTLRDAPRLIQGPTSQGPGAPDFPLGFTEGRRGVQSALRRRRSRAPTPRTLAPRRPPTRRGRLESLVAGADGETPNPPLAWTLAASRHPVPLAGRVQRRRAPGARRRRRRAPGARRRRRPRRRACGPRAGWGRRVAGPTETEREGLGRGARTAGTCEV